MAMAAMAMASAAVSLLLLAAHAHGLDANNQHRDITRQPIRNISRVDLEFVLEANLVFHLWALGANDSEPNEETITVRTVNRASDEECLFTNYVSDAPIKLLIHGFNSHGKVDWILDMKTKYLKRFKQINVISVDWKKEATGSLWAYSLVSDFTPSVAQSASRMVRMMDACQGDSSAVRDGLHIIGHSLGAHIAGFTGRYLQGNVARITGLDPAAPGFRSEPRLSAANARFVDVIHTGGVTLALITPLGHADFYPNGGENAQPGCGFVATPFTFDCSHHRAVDLFVESIDNTNAFPARMCSSWRHFKSGYCPDSSPAALMGDSINATSAGKFYLSTRGAAPFSIPEIRLQLELRDDDGNRLESGGAA